MRRRAIVFFLPLAGLIVALGCLCFAHPVSALLANHWGEAILRSGDGKFSDATVFLQHRISEAGLLLATFVGLAAICIAGATLLARRLPPMWKWTAFSVTGFIGLNIWLKIATTTVLFWCLFWNGKGSTDNLTQFHIKLLLTDENACATKVVLGGSSQVRTEIDAKQLNASFGSNFFTTELHFPGNHAFDFLFLDRELHRHKTTAVVCYLSEANFYVGGVSDGFKLFFTLRDIPNYFRLGGRTRWSPGSLGYGLLSDLLPAFWLRDPISNRLLGETLVHLRQEEFDDSLNSDLAKRAKEAAPMYRLDSQAVFCFNSFEEFVARSKAEGHKVIICDGQVNPLLARELDPRLRPHMVRFFEHLAAKYGNVTLLRQSEFPVQTEKDYEDLVHANDAAKERFTAALGARLKSVLQPSHLKATQ